MNFSQRYGYTPIRDIIQLESIDDRLRIKLFNYIHSILFTQLDQWNKLGGYTETIKIRRHIWTNFFDGFIDDTPAYYSTIEGYKFKRVFKDKFFKLQWYEIYNLIEFICEMDGDYFHLNFQQGCNEVLKIENSGYRIVNNSILQTTNEEELNEIEQALTIPEDNIKTHFKSALNLLTNRENPDYRNSIKESISSVEALCCKIVNNNKATLGDALKIIEKKHNLHGSLKKAFSSLYGYTSDAGGIRHSLLDDDVEISYDDAKFMLVSCSAFTNYLQAKVQ